MTLEELYKVIEERKKQTPKGSYVVSLFRGGNNSIVQKIGEEAVEVVIAGKGKNKKQIISEVADLLFHCLVLLSSFNIPLTEVFAELERRKKSTT